MPKSFRTINPNQNFIFFLFIIVEFLVKLAYTSSAISGPNRDFIHRRKYVFSESSPFIRLASWTFKKGH